MFLIALASVPFLIVALLAGNGQSRHPVNRMTRQFNRTASPFKPYKG